MNLYVAYSLNIMKQWDGVFEIALALLFASYYLVIS